MNWQEYKQDMREEWEFHKRHPELIFVWIVYIIAFIYAMSH